MLKTLGAQIKEFKKRLHQDSVIYDSGSPDGDADSFSHGIHHR